MTDIRKLACVGLMSLGVVSIGCASNNDNSGKGGSNGSGGSSSSGGSSGSKGGSTGSGGSSSTGSGGSNSTGSGGSSSTGSGGSSAAIACGPAGTGTTTPPPAALITDFSDAATAGADAGTAAGKITYGTTSTVMGGVTTFQNPASTAGTTMITSGALVFNATVSAAGTASADMYPYSGVVVYVNGPACVDASSYQGVSFSISGSVGTCGLVFSFDDAEHGATSTADPRFVGDSSAYPPQLSIGSMVTSAATTIQVPFTDAMFANGSPAFSAGGIDPKAITGVQWQFTNSNTSTAACTGSITIDNVTFY